ncbi:MAG: hypothetical protein C0599_05110 [Salinivirgaceae bacterium]|nr:MAG: hypothetical protein C0599_05110 [Salinivirgaceae bacterium]
MKMSKSHIIAYAISIVVLIILAIQIYKRYFSEKIAPKIDEVLLQKRDMDIVFGNDSANLTMYVYASYQCSYCRKFFDEVFPILENKYIESGQLNVIFRPTARTVGNERENALKALVCVNKYGNFTYLHKLLLSNFRVMYTDEFIQMVNSFKDKDPFVGECIDGTEAKDYLTANIKEFEKLEFKGTPTFVINNRVYIGYRETEQMEKIIDNLLQNKITSNINH